MSLSDRLKELLKPKGRGAQAALARACKVKPPSVADWVSGKTKTLEGENLLDAADFFGVDPHWLATGRGRKFKNESIPAPGIDAASRLHKLSIEVPILAVAGSMGEGSEGDSEDVMVGALELSARWIHDSIKPTADSKLRFIHSYGDSMSPTLNSGDVVLVDTGVKEVLIGGIYVLRAHNRIFIKRVRQRMDGLFEISSDNPAVKTVDLLDGNHQVELLGRVVWVWNGKKV